MSMPELTKRPIHGRLVTVCWWGAFALFLITSFSLSGTSLPTMSGIDASWQASIEYAAVHKLQFGRDIVFTYGPLGFLGSQCSQGHFILLRVLFAFVWAVLTACALLHAVRAGKGPVRALLLVWIILFASFGDLEQNAFFVMAWCSVLLLDRHLKVPVSAAIASLLALLSLIKFTLFLGAVITVACFLIHRAGERHIRQAATPILSFVVSLVFFWKILGQEIGNLWPWLYRNLELSAGYSEAMSIAPKPAVLVFSLVAMALFLFMVFRSASMDGFSLQKSMVPAVVTLYVFLAWKQGIVRADEMHMLRFVLVLPLLAAILIIHRDLSEKPVYAGRLFMAAFTGLIIASGLSVYLLEGRQLTGRFVGFPRNLALQFSIAKQAATGNFKDCFEALNPVPRDISLPEAKALIGDSTVDVMNSLTWAAMSNGMNYRPRPVIQGYAAYTPYLQQLNRAFMQSDKRPDWLLMMMETIDGKIPTMDDNLLYPWVLRNYRPEGIDGRFLLLRLTSPHPLPPPQELVSEQVLNFGEPVATSGWSGSVLLCQLEIETTLLGKLAGIFYQRPHLSLDIDFAGRRMTRRLNPASSREGVLLNPLIVSIPDLVAYYNGSPPQMDSFTVSRSGSAKLLYKDKIKVRILRVMM